MPQIFVNPFSRGRSCNIHANHDERQEQMNEKNDMNKSRAQAQSNQVELEVSIEQNDSKRIARLLLDTENRRYRHAFARVKCV
uniref:Uncharacterized protein n=1 Tax=Syphacia muris TaxID=451379 RepID=A0A0N5AWZ7_9BILA